MKATDSTGLPLTPAPDARVMLSFQAAMAALIMPHHGPFGKAWADIGLLIREADATEDPERRAFVRERAQKYSVSCLRAYMAGKRLPKLRRLRTVKRAPRDDSRQGAETRGALADDPVLRAIADDLGQAAVLIGRPHGPSSPSAFDTHPTPTIPSK
jgi:hypothetical protein